LNLKYGWNGDTVTPSKNETGINEYSVSEVYRRVLAGEKLETIRVKEGIKDIILAFFKYSTLSACQISEKTGISVAICTKLRKISRSKRHLGDDRHGVAFSATMLLTNKDVEYLKLHFVAPETIKKAKKCLRILEAGGKAPDLYKLGLSHPQALRLIGLYHETHVGVSVPTSPTC
jgi:hypothetical protein